MQKGFGLTAAAVLLGLLVVVLYPALLLGNRVAPEASLRGTVPWREQWGPHPQPRPTAVRVALTLAPRLASIAADGLAGALWNPYIGGGRAGWLASPEHGGAPLTVVAGLLARPGWAFTALVATSIAASFLAAGWVLRKLGLSPWAAAVGGVAYTLSGAVTTAMLEPSGSAVVLGPLALIPALSPAPSLARRAALWGIPLVVLAWSGQASLPFVVLGIVLALLRQPRRPGRTLVPVLVAVVLAGAALAPRLWLARAGSEAGAPVPAPRIAAPLASPLAFVLEQPVDLAPPVPTAVTLPRSTPAAALLGLPVVLLGLVGLARIRSGADLLWPSVVLGAGALAFAPAAAVVRIGLAERPLALVALAAAVLAAFGTELLLLRLQSTRGRALAGAAVCLAVGARLLPAAAGHIPFAPAAESSLPSPVPVTACADGSRLVALLDAMPPDSAAVLSLHDARAADLGDEPFYAAALAAEPGGLLPISSALSPGLSRLGVRWVLEPLPLRVVSGEIFANVDVQSAGRVAAGPGWAEYSVAPADGASRIGLPAGAPVVGRVAVGREGRLLTLIEDETLEGETTAWRWWSLPGPAEGPELALRCELSADAPPDEIEVALDRSHLALVGESLGARVWRRDDARELAAAAPPRAASVRLLEASARRVAVEVVASAEVTLTTLVKYRPGLWRATIDGEPVATRPADGLWTAVQVPRGSHRVIFEASLPGTVWSVSVAALALLAAAWGAGRRS